MRIAPWKIALLVLCCIALAFELWHLRGSRHSDPKQDAIRTQTTKPGFVLLPATEAIAFANEFLDTPRNRVKSWEPTVGDIDDLEANLPQLSDLSEMSHNSNRHVDDPGQYFRQYLAIIDGGKKLIFVNAFCSVDRANPDNWRKHLVVVIDGGKCFWHATYDPSNQKFSDLIISGPA